MNHLVHETSPYLLQHAHNPVDWYAWKPEALERAKREDKPILVSIGYSTCHWCHVMERESFENQSVAEVMNENFICIKVDREERPDVDQIYMEACQVISGGGGWPLNCFLTPDGRPFFAGTYYPPESAYGRPSWLQVLHNMRNAFGEKRQIVEEQADKLTQIIRDADKNYIKNDFSTTFNALNTEGGVDDDFLKKFNPVLLDNIFYNLQQRFDSEEGGFGGAPKFPGTMCIQFLLDYYFYSKNENALAHAELSLIKMIQGGIYDQLGGGFARYATDRAWLVPHFEKMLYDNALIISVLADAYKLTKKQIYRETIEETLGFIQREMQNTEPANPSVGAVFFSAYDADSEGVEGKFYVWSKAEIEQILGEDAPLFCQFYDVSEEGNWEETNILHRDLNYEMFAQNLNLDVSYLKNKLKESRDKLFNIRDLRIKPGLDDKILLSWNALMISAFARAHEAINTKNYAQIAQGALDTVLEKFKSNEKPYALFHTYKNGQAQYSAFLEDYAFLIEAMIDVYGVTFDKKYLHLAKEYTDFTFENFFDTTANLFYFTSENQTDIILRKKEVFDSATPSGNSTMVRNLLRLSVFFANEKYKILAVNMLRAVFDSFERYPTSFGRWASGAISVVYPPYEIAVVGKTATSDILPINALFLPNKIAMASVESDDFPLLEGKMAKNTEGGQSLIYVCQNYACQKPVDNFDDFLETLSGLSS